MDGAARPRPLGGAAALLGTRALVRRHQSADALGTPPRPRGRGHRRAAQLCGIAAAGRVRADRQGRRAPADHRGDAPLRALLAGRRAGCTPLALPKPSPTRRPLATPTWRTCGLCPDVRLIPGGKAATARLQRPEGAIQLASGPDAERQVLGEEV